MDNIFEFIPEECKEKNLPTPEEIEFWRLSKNRTYVLDYEIEDDYRCIELIKTLIRMNIEEKDIPENELKPITLYLFTYGGSLEQAMALCDVVEASRIPIITVCLGVAMSAGFLIFLAGKRRYAFRQGSFMIHQGDATLSGSADMIQQAQDNYKRQLKQMKDYILEHTSIDSKLFSKNKLKDWYLSTTEAEKLGVCKVIKSFNEII